MAGLAIAGAAVLLVLAGCSGPADESAQPAAAAPTQSAPAVPPPPVSVNAEMVALVDHAGHALWDVEQEGRAPKTDADWANIEEHATQLAAAGHLIMLGGAGPNDLVWKEETGWREAARAMSDAGVAALNAAHAKNFDALLVANGQLVESCESCHRQFKPELPSEGLLHTHAH
jgi:hypothetical protein